MSVDQKAGPLEQAWRRYHHPKAEELTIHAIRDPQTGLRYPIMQSFEELCMAPPDDLSVWMERERR